MRMVFVLIEIDEKNWKWELLSNGLSIAMSAESFESRIEAMAAVDVFRNTVAQIPAPRPPLKPRRDE